VTTAIGAGHRPRKRFGQNFLTDPHVIEHILQCVALQSGDTAVEIGPGRGALTEGLIRSGADLHLIELDRDLAAIWLKRASDRLRVHVGDALRFDFAAIAPGPGALRVLGNLPYNISTPLLFHLLSFKPWLRDMHFMLQREVVQRLGAAPGGKDYGRLSVMVQYHCEVETLFDVPPGAFSPPPRVTSSVVRLQPRDFPGPPARSLEMLARVLRQAFAQRRKTLRNALAGLVEPAALQAEGIDPGRRPETLSVEEFVSISNCAGLEPPGRDD